MAYGILNGYGSPAMIIQRKSDLVNIATINLDLCMIESGLTEDYTEDFKRIYLEKNSEIVDYDFKGARIKFNLDYVSLCTGDNLMKLDIIEAYNSQPLIYDLYFQPRTTLSQGRTFRVRSSGDGFSQGIHSGANGSAIGHKGVKVSYITVFPVSKNFITIDDSGISFFHGL